MSFTSTFTLSFWLLIVIALVVSSIGFYKYVYFISLGYGFSIAAMGIAMPILFLNHLSIGIIISCVLLVVYGCRLGGYLLIRELKSVSYRNTMKKEIKDGKTIKMTAKLSIWMSCSLLYVLQISPVFLRLQNGAQTDIFCIVGAIIMLGGILLESFADIQKAKAKKKNPSRFCDSGLYKIVRCPNYLGEILFWTGVFISGLNIYDGVWQWLAALFGFICIVYIMFGGARRLEIRQNKNYGADPQYQAYVKKTPILLPFFPLYSVEKYKWLVG